MLDKNRVLKPLNFYVVPQEKKKKKRKNGYIKTLNTFLAVFNL